MNKDGTVYDSIGMDEKIKEALMAFGKAQNARKEAEDQLRKFEDHEKHFGIVIANLLLEKKNRGC